MCYLRHLFKVIPVGKITSTKRNCSGVDICKQQANKLFEEERQSNVGCKKRQNNDTLTKIVI